jgi:anthranilate phosphoribosyltransferase
MTSAVEAIVSGQCAEGEIGLFLTGLRARGETAEEIAGAATALRNAMTPIRSNHAQLVDTCGTGGDRSGTFNISTAAALVTAAAGVPVAKHGNRSVTSRSGSADVLAELGVNIEAPLATVEACLDELGICFCFAPLMHASMRNVADVRRKLAMPTIFNLLGPLANPASAPYQVVGVGDPAWVTLMAQALALLKTTRAIVVHGNDGLDEVTLDGPTQVILVDDGQLSELEWTPDDFGISRSPLTDLAVDGPKSSAAIIRDVFQGHPGPARDIVVLNAAAALWTAGAADSPTEASLRAAEAIDRGAAAQLLKQLSRRTHA